MPALRLKSVVDAYDMSVCVWCVWCGVVWYVVWCVWYVVWCGVVWCGVVWFGVVWRGCLQHA